MTEPAPPTKAPTPSTTVVPSTAACGCDVTSGGLYHRGTEEAADPRWQDCHTTPASSWLATHADDGAAGADPFRPSGTPGERYVGVVSEVVRIELGVSILQGELIAQEAEAAGLRVQLLRNEHPETGAAFVLGTSALLVAAEHEAEVRELLAEHGY